MSDFCKEIGVCDLIRARRVERHPPTLLICAAPGRLPNVEGVGPTLFSAYRPIDQPKQGWGYANFAEFLFHALG
jgi:hypothetical protein